MSYSLSFSAGFYGDCYESEASDRPTTVASAIRSMSDDDWNSLARDVFGCGPDYLDVDVVLTKVVETDTCSDLCSPVCVWIDPEGYYTLLVYDEVDEDI